MAGARDMAGHTLLSCEAGCYNGALRHDVGGNTASPTAPNQALFTINSIFAAGVNQAMIHGFTYLTSPGVPWPGFAAFTPDGNSASGFGEAWGPRPPHWKHASGVSDYFTAPSCVCRPGHPGTTSAFWRHKGWASHRHRSRQWIDQQRHQARLVARPS